MFLFIFSFILLQSCNAQPWQRSTTLDLDGKVRISWNITKAQTGDLLDLQVSAPTTGYVGLGFSWNGAMRGSDIVVGWVDNDGSGHLRDFHGVGNVKPVLDQVQNYKLIAAEETEGVTTIRFQRPLKTCDENDLDITNDTMRIIWAYEQQDPEFGGESVFFQYHGANNRGVKSVYLIDVPLAAPFPDELEEPDPSIKYWDVMLENVSPDLFCSSECTEKALPPQGIKIVSVLLHAHLAGRRIKLRHFRNGTELPVIAEDKAYDFNYQQSRYLKKEITVLPGDELLTECEFDTMDRNHFVLGGLTSREEMCQSFIMYYPKVELSLCSSQYEFYNFFEALGITNVSSRVFPFMRLPYNPNTWPTELQKLDPPDDSIQLESLLTGQRDAYDLMEIEEPAGLNHTSVGNYLQHKNWKDRTESKSIEKRWKEGRHYAYCTLSGRRRIPLKDYVTELPRSELSPQAQERDSHCAAEGTLSASTSPMTSVPNLLLAFTFIVLGFGF